MFHVERFSSTLDLMLEEWTPEELALKSLADVCCRSFLATKPFRKTFSVIWPFGLVVKANSQNLAVMEWMIAVGAEDHAFIYHQKQKPRHTGQGF